jgi:alkanesulfonate monooxygenase SsuD/methylene tetrahydromethanopterin reductase-like flavin-dependent oxidoreductase (luciferase family)
MELAVGGAHRALIEQRSNAFAAACRAAGRCVTDVDVCKMTFMAVAPDSAVARRMRDELATRSTISPEALAARTVVGTPDVIVERSRALTEIGVNHRVFNVAESAQWPNYREATEPLSREVVPRVRQR